MQRSIHMERAMFVVAVVGLGIAFFSCVAAYLALPQIQILVTGLAKSSPVPSLTPSRTTVVAVAVPPETSATIIPLPTATLPPVALTPVMLLATANATLNVRDGPSTTYSVLAKLKQGDQRVITGKSQDGQWWQIDLDGKPGWISAGFATSNSSLDSVPVVHVQSPTPLPTSKPAPAVPTAGTMNLTGRVASDIPGTQIALGSTVSSVVDYNTKLHDVYAIDLVAGQGVRFTVSNDDGYLYLGLYNPSSQSIETNRVSPAFTANGSGKWVRDFTPAVSGTYYFAIQATPASTGQTYAFSVMRLD